MLFIVEFLKIVKIIFCSIKSVVLKILIFLMDKLRAKNWGASFMSNFRQLSWIDKRSSIKAKERMKAIKSKNCLNEQISWLFFKGIKKRCFTLKIFNGWNRGYSIYSTKTQIFLEKMNLEAKNPKDMIVR